MKNKHHNYNSKLKTYARHLRKNSTKAEIRLWSELLRSRKMHGYSFNRQRPIDQYIVDFYASQLKLIIEVDGWTHDDPDAMQQDEKRQSKLESLGYTFLRFTNHEVLHHLEEVEIRISNKVRGLEKKLADPPPPAPP